MSGSSTIIEDGSLQSRLDRQLLKVERFLALISGFTVVGMILMAVVSVGGRNIIDHPLPGYIDWIEQLMPLIAFMGISYTQREGGHIRMDMLVSRLKGRALWAVEWVTTLLVLVLIALLIWGSFAHFQRSFDFGAPLWSRDSSIDIGLPLWPAKLVAPVAFCVLALRLVLQLWGYTRALVAGGDRAVGVPLIEDIETQAKREADQLQDREPGV